MCRTPISKRIYIGIDLAAKESKCSGFAYIACRGVCVVKEVFCLHRDDDIVTAVAELYRSSRNIYISVDAPLSYSSGMRRVDRRMISMGFRVFPPNFSYMKMLTMRAVNIVGRLRALGIANIYETHPKSSILNSGCSSVGELLEELSIKHAIDVDRLGRDLSDAIICAAVSYCIDSKCCIRVGEVDGEIWLIDRVCVSREAVQD